MTGVNSGNVVVAMALVVGAGSATAVGASVVFFPALVKLASRRVLASALGLSAGVMTYVSFVEILQKSNSSFQDAGYSENDAYLYATLCFFGGAVFMIIVDVVVKVISGGKDHHSHEQEHDHEIEVGAQDKSNEEKQEGELRVTNFSCCSKDPVGDLALLQRQADEIMAHDHYGHGHGSSRDHNVSNSINNTNNNNNNNDSIETGSSSGSEDKQLEKEKLIKMGINTAIAIGLHNFPEGLATFVSALNDPKVGAVLAVAIGIHNIPEGLCVALPIYYATGNRWKAFGWALVSGISEPFAALLGWAVLANSFSNVMYAILFGGVAGMMVIISSRELLPTAHRYDPEDTVVTFSFIAGMVIMALSLVLFVL